MSGAGLTRFGRVVRWCGRRRSRRRGDGRPDPLRPAMRVGLWKGVRWMRRGWVGCGGGRHAACLPAGSSNMLKGRPATRPWPVHSPHAAPRPRGRDPQGRVPDHRSSGPPRWQAASSVRDVPCVDIRIVAAVRARAGACPAPLPWVVLTKCPVSDVTVAPNRVFGLARVPFPRKRSDPTTVRWATDPGGDTSTREMLGFAPPGRLLWVVPGSARHHARSSQTAGHLTANCEKL